MRKNMRKIIGNILVTCYILVAMLLVCACNDQLDIQQSYPFSIETMPVPKKLKAGETAEIRCTLKREGRFEDARYTIRFFQPDGVGILKMDDGTAFLPNDRYPLTKEVFRLYYTSQTSDQSVIDVYIEDNAGQMVQLSFNFANDSTEKEDDNGN